MKKVIKVLACLLSPLALFSCACKTAEVKISIEEKIEEIKVDEKGQEVEIPEITGNVKGKAGATETLEKAKVKVSVIKSYKVCKEIKGKETKSVCSEFKKFDNVTKLMEYVAKNNNTDESFKD